LTKHALRSGATRKCF